MDDSIGERPGEPVVLRVAMRGTIEKRDAAGDIFEVVEVDVDDDGAGGCRGRVIYRRAGEPAESYAALPYKPRQDEETKP